jgi:DNA-binding Lrp family transcriptional regulator
MGKNTGNKKETLINSIETNTGDAIITDKSSGKLKKRKKIKKITETPPPSVILEPAEIKTTSGEKRKTKKQDYVPADFPSIQAMSTLRGFAPLGMLFVLMDVLGGEEGTLRVNRLAEALAIGKPAILAQLDNLESAGLIRTVSSSQRGRHIELLVSNVVTSKKTFDPCSSPVEELLPIIGPVPEGLPPAFSPEKLRDLQLYLINRGIRVTYLPDESDLDPRVSAVANFLGRYLVWIRPFYTRLKATLNEGQEIEFSLVGYQGRDVTHTLNFCRMLQDAGFLAAFTYRHAPHCRIVARLNRTPAAINFLSGGWLEHYIRDRVVSILGTHPATHNMPFAFMKNPRILLPEDEDFEFDFLLTIGEKIFWIEAKTGEYMEFLSKYERVSKLMGLSRNNTLIVLVDAPKPDDRAASHYDLSCCNVDEFAEVFRLMLVRELGRRRR